MNVKRSCISPALPNHGSRGQQGSGKCGQHSGTTFMLRVAPVKGRHQGADIEQPRTHDRVFIRSRCARHGSLSWGTGAKSRRPKWRPARSPTVPGGRSCPAINSRTSSDSVRPEAAARARNAFRWAAAKQMVSVSDMSETLSIVRHSARHTGSRNSSRGICPRQALPREVRSICMGACTHVRIIPGQCGRISRILNGMASNSVQRYRAINPPAPASRLNPASVRSG